MTYLSPSLLSRLAASATEDTQSSINLLHAVQPFTNPPLARVDCCFVPLQQPNHAAKSFPTLDSSSITTRSCTLARKAHQVILAPPGHSTCRDARCQTILPPSLGSHGVGECIIFSLALSSCRRGCRCRRRCFSLLIRRLHVAARSWCQRRGPDVSISVPSLVNQFVRLEDVPDEGPNVACKKKNSNTRQRFSICAPVTAVQGGYLT